MTELALVGDIGGTNSRFGLVEPGSTRIRDIEVLKNNNFGSLEESISTYVKMKGLTQTAAAATAEPARKPSAERQQRHRHALRRLLHCPPRERQREVLPGDPAIHVIEIGDAHAEFDEVQNHGAH